MKSIISMTRKTFFKAAVFVAISVGLCHLFAITLSTTPVFEALLNVSCIGSFVISGAGLLSSKKDSLIRSARDILCFLVLWAAILAATMLFPGFVLDSHSHSFKTLDVGLLACIILAPGALGIMGATMVF